MEDWCISSKDYTANEFAEEIEKKRQRKKRIKKRREEYGNLIRKMEKLNPDIKSERLCR